MEHAQTALAALPHADPPAARAALGALRARRTVEIGGRRGAPPGTTRHRLGVGKTSARPRRGEPERALMLAVLTDAIRCLAGEVQPISERAQLAAKARRWVRDRDLSEPFSFENVCLALTLEPDGVRSRLLGSPAALKAIHGRLIETVLAF
jgi:hypothetical protein